MAHRSADRSRSPSKDHCVSDEDSAEVSKRSCPGNLGRSTTQRRAYPREFSFSDAVSYQPDLTLQQLPYDVIHIIAQCLAEESLLDGNDGTPRTTLARLNRVSKAVHEATLPVLYETTDYFGKWDFTDSVGLENPKGWAWTK
jgi:hypothetical protein